MRTTDTGADGAVPLIELSGLNVVLPTGERSEVQAVRSVDLVVHDGERVGLVGESGSGKSVTGRSIAGLLPTSPRVRVSGSIRIRGREMVGAAERTWDEVRQRTVGMIFQDPLTFLNPTMRIGRQVAESLSTRRGSGGSGSSGSGSSRSGSNRRAIREESVQRFLRQAGLPDPAQVAASFPHELSGGMRQRVLIAIAIAKEPSLVLADEPTTALDATVQQHVLRTLDETVAELGTSLLLISHDLAVVAGMTDRVYVMYAGRIVEEGPTDRVLADPQHEYTRALLRSVRSLTEADTELYSIPLQTRQRFAQEASRAT
ncbi:ABC transporter ATP-binding protein [Microbacterium sp. A93]|uniref:ABC transporter ATP-binding protein n=1 Tax=Microbacterium sp. A93 TaxID=3450716 RepID=UPI003F4386C1